MAGVSKILIPVKLEDLNEDKILEYLPQVCQAFKANQQNIQAHYKEYCLEQNILSKSRLYDSESEINNKILVPHLAALVDFKTGYAFGNPIQYAQNQSTDTDDIQYLNKYTNNVHKRTIDKAVGTWVYATGVGYYFIQPVDREINPEWESPFELYCIDSDSCCKVYSAYLGKKPLFDVLITYINDYTLDGKTPSVKTIVDVYTADWFYEFEGDSSCSTFNRVNVQPRAIYKELPLVEKRANESGIGIVEMVDTIQDALNDTTSNELDNIEELVNQIFVYKNANLGDTPEEAAENHKAMVKNRAIILTTPNGQDYEADLKTLTVSLNLDDVNIFYNTLKQEMYDCVGVPLASSAVTSGGDTGSARQLGNGWENAYNRLLDDINSFLKSDRELLDKMLVICKKTPNNKVNELQSSEIDIKYDPNMTDNMLVKSQSYVNYVEHGVPPQVALAFVRVTNDPITVGAKIIEWQKEQEANAEKQVETSDKQAEITIEEKTDIQ